MELTTSNSSFDTHRLWDEKLVSVYLGVSIQFLQQDRVHARRLPFIKIGRSVRYDPADVLSFAAKCKVSAPQS